MFLTKEKINPHFVKDLNVTPIFCESNLIFWREENAGYYTVIPKNFPFINYLIINPTGKKILDLCNGENTLQKICNELINLYPEVPKEEITKDIAEILFDFSRCDLIQWKGGNNPFMYINEKKLDNGVIISTALDNELKEICQYFESILANYKQQKGRLTYINPIIRPNDYLSELILRQKLFNYSEEFFLLRENNKINGIITLLIPVEKHFTVATIGVMDVNREYLPSMIDYIAEVIPRIAVKEITKIELQLLKDANITQLIENLIKNTGFINEGTLKHELGEKDLCIYSYFLV